MISGTAHMTAYARALEARRSDALFDDPFAQRLASPEGEALLQASGVADVFVRGIGARTAVFDELILQKIRAEGVDLVLNLAAGLDSRPWRLDVPNSLRWIDADLPQVLEHKRRALQSFTPRCQYVAVPADLTDGRALVSLIDQCHGATKGLVVSEGLLVYLHTEQVSGLARHLHAQGALRYWITDVAGPRALSMLRRTWGRVLPEVGYQFAPPDSTHFFEALGWREIEWRSSQEEARRLDRAPHPTWFARLVLYLLPTRFREELRRLASYSVLEWQAAAGGVNSRS